ncbi:NAD(P)-binding protein, partial [Bifidobacterium pseudocatenulatum]
MTEAVEYPDLVVVGAGLFGLTVAQQAAERLGVRVEIIDVRDHIGGN